MSLDAKERAAEVYEEKQQYGNAAYEYHEAQAEAERAGNYEAAKDYEMKFEEAKRRVRSE